MSECFLPSVSIFFLNAQSSHTRLLVRIRDLLFLPAPLAFGFDASFASRGVRLHVKKGSNAAINVYALASENCKHDCLKTISAPNNIVAALNEPYKACTTLAGLPPAEHAKLQLHHYFWSIKTHHHQFATHEQKACVKAVLYSLGPVGKYSI